MAEFVLEYPALRWSVVVAFLLAGVVVAARAMSAVPVAAASVASARGPASVARLTGAHDRESDAAHLIMCAVMLAMLVFPVQAHAHAMRGVLIAMTVAFAMLLVVRVVEWHVDGRALPVARASALGYHVIAAAVMLYAMSGHTASGHTGGPAVMPAMGLAALFVVDAGVLLACTATGRPPRWLAHAGAHPGGFVPHIVMDLGTAYMLVAAVAG
ncbi:DUF5134 domain-containing protein [Nocardia cyriacigeorgica]|uniref:DUF5134 domain-containing protein n=1 Tax=Nocardia cyriacigeorgica TaxID=135487 RepID=UPI002453FA45|nr:DUF5134 domain-containing protein [Nocardia cyriacigeorgica]